MYFYTQFSHTTSQRFSAANNEKDADLPHNDIYTDLIREFYDKYELPALHHDGDGFRQGDASDEELVKLSNRLRIDCKKSLDFFPLFNFLDKEFMSIEKEAYDAVLAKYEDDTFQDLKEKYEIETYGTSVYVYADDSDDENFKQEAEELLTLMQTYNELLKFELEFIETEDSHNGFRAIFHYNAEEIIKHYCGNVDVAKEATTELIVTVDCGLNEQDDYHDIATKLLKYEVRELVLVQEDYEDTFDKDANNKHFYKKNVIKRS